MSIEKRCKHCARTGEHLRQAYTGWYFKRPDGFECRNPLACAKRAAQLGKWTGTRVLRRQDRDGTRWTIRRHDDLGLRGLDLQQGPWTDGWVLICEYRAHRLVSWHPTREKAKAHRDDLVRSWEARSMREYVGGAR